MTTVRLWCQWVLLLLAWVTSRCRGKLVFVEGPPQLVALPPTYCPTWDMYIGPQYDDAGLGRTRSQLVWFNDDPCDAGAIARQASLMNGRAVLLGNPNGVCSPSLMYDMFRATNATVVATIDASPVPTYGGILMDDVYGRRRHPGGMLFVRFHLDSDMANVLTRTVSDSNAASVVIEVTPDYNVWLDVIASWWYIVFVQVLPAIYYGTCSVLAVFYLYRHICFAISEPDHATPVTMRNRSRSLCGPLGRVVLRWSIPQTALLVESAATMVLCVNSARPSTSTTWHYVCFNRSCLGSVAPAHFCLPFSGAGAATSCSRAANLLRRLKDSQADISDF